MKISLIQQNIVWENRSANLENLEREISKIPPGTNIVALPEMFTTGFSMNPEILSEGPESITYEWMQKASAEGGFAVCGSYIVKEDGFYYNRWVFVGPEGESWSYDKRHLFGPGGEDKAYRKGNGRIVFSFRGVGICPFICYDLRFPVWMRNRNEYDLLIISANWPESRSEVWKTLLKARAIENQCYVAGINRVGKDGRDIRYKGDSMIIDPFGEIIVHAEENEDCIVSADISIQDLLRFRENFPVARDSDNFTISL
ncbi:MAG: amidohydrolase [Bacteroidales bacterium]|jgi:omega-amidase